MPGLEIKAGTAIARKKTKRKNACFLFDYTEDVKRRLVILSEDHDSKFWPYFSNRQNKKTFQGASIFHPMQTEHAKNIYHSFRTDVVCSADPEKFGMKAC